MHNDDRVHFWHDEWCGQVVLHNLFPNLFLMDNRQQVFVAENFKLSSGRIV